MTTAHHLAGVAGMPLDDWYWHHVRPTLSLADGRLETYDAAVAAFVREAGPRRVSDVSEELLSDFTMLRLPGAAGSSHTAEYRESLGGYIRRLVRIWNPDALAPRLRGGDLFRLAAAASVEEDEKLLIFWYRRNFRPQLAAKVSDGRVSVYDRAVQLINSFAGRRLQLQSIDEKLLRNFVAGEHKGHKGKHTRKHRLEMAHCVRKIVRAWCPEALAGARERPDLKLPPPAPNSLREYFHEVYLPQAMFSKSAGAQESTERAIRRLVEFAGRDVMLAELNDSLAAAFFRSLITEGMPETSINSGYRAPLFAVCRHAKRAGKTAYDSGVPKLREKREDPDAFTLDEFGRILAAALEFEVGPIYEGRLYGKVPANHWWHAILLTAYWSGLRRGSILTALRTDFDPSTGWLTVRASNVKTRRAKRCRLGPDAVAAIARIWEPARELLFPAPNATTICKHFGRILTAAGIPKSKRKGPSKFHRIRRTAATQAYMANGISAASTLLGHANFATTFNHYIDGRAVKDNDCTQLLPTPKLPKKPR